MNDLGDRIAARPDHGGVLLVPCQINTSCRYWLPADTGAALTVLSPRVADEVGLDAGRPPRYEQITSVHRTQRAPVVRLDRLQVGRHWATDVEALVLALPHSLRIDGLLGVNFLRRFRPTFEYDTATLVLRAHRAGSRSAS